MTLNKYIYVHKLLSNLESTIFISFLKFLVGENLAGCFVCNTINQFLGTKHGEKFNTDNINFPRFSSCGCPENSGLGN